MSDEPTIYGIIEQLQKSLDRGWHEFKQSKEFIELEKFATFLQDVAFFESEFRGTIPHPAHEYAARAMGNHFLETARNLDLHFSDFFPGDYRKSNEIEEKGYMVRRFYLDMYQHRELLCSVSISFTHLHDKFDFPERPTIKLERLYTRQ